jgi:hypothetical protein
LRPLAVVRESFTFSAAFAAATFLESIACGVASSKFESCNASSNKLSSSFVRPGTDPVEHWDDKLLFEQDNSTITTDLLTSSSSPVLLLQRVLLQLLQPLLQLLLQPLNPRPTLHLTLLPPLPPVLLLLALETVQQ